MRTTRAITNSNQLAAISGKPTLAEIESSSALAMESTVAGIPTTLAGTHGAGNWEGTTPEEIQGELASVHGAGLWAKRRGIFK